MGQSLVSCSVNGYSLICCDFSFRSSGSPIICTSSKIGFLERILSSMEWLDYWTQLRLFILYFYFNCARYAAGRATCRNRYDSIGAPLLCSLGYSALVDASWRENTKLQVINFHCSTPARSDRICVLTRMLMGCFLKTSTLFFTDHCPVSACVMSAPLFIPPLRIVYT